MGLPRTGTVPLNKPIKVCKLGLSNENKSENGKMRRRRSLKQVNTLKHCLEGLGIYSNIFPYRRL
jgi:hypothetical protein